MIYILAVLAGGMVILSMTMNSQLSKSTGTFQGVFINYAVGFISALAIFAFCIVFNIDSGKISIIAAPWYAYLGAFLGIGIVATSNIIIPKIPVVYSALLIFLGQISSGLIFDTFFLSYFDTYKAIGALIIAFGLFMNAKIDALSVS